MPTTIATVPPAHAWDWVGRQRLVWSEARRRLAPAPAVGAEGSARPSDVPDWSDLLDRGPVRGVAGSASRRDAQPAAPLATDWSALATRAEVMAALRAAYPVDERVRDAVDGAVVDVAFLGHRGGDLAVLGVRTPPRGLRWWWTHLGGHLAADPAAPAAAVATAGVQLTLLDVLTGYGDPGRIG